MMCGFYIKVLYNDYANKHKGNTIEEQITSRTIVGSCRRSRNIGNTEDEKKRKPYSTL